MNTGFCRFRNIEIIYETVGSNQLDPANPFPILKPGSCSRYDAGSQCAQFNCALKLGANMQSQSPL